MSTTYQTEDATEGHIDPFFYPGENDVPESVRKEAILANFTSEELQDEVMRRVFAPFNESLENLKVTIDNFGVDPERPF